MAPENQSIQGNQSNQETRVFLMYSGGVESQG